MKSIIKTISGNVVTISDVEIVGEFQDPFKNGIIKNLDMSRFASQFRNKTFKLAADGSWAIVHSGIPSGISRIQHQEDLSKAMGFSTGSNGDEMSSPQQNLSELQKLADSLKQFDLSKIELESVHEVITDQDTEVQCIITIKDVIQAYSEQQSDVDETSLKYIWILQVVAERFGSSLLPDSEQRSVSTVVDGFAVDKVEILHRAINKVVQKITLDDDSIQLSSVITNPQQYGNFLTTVNNVLKVITEVSANKRAKANNTISQDSTNNVPTPPISGQPQPNTEMQQFMNMMQGLMAQQNQRMLDMFADQNNLQSTSWINVANDIAQNKALSIANKVDTDRTLVEIQNTVQDLSVRISTIETGNNTPIQPPTTNITNSTNTPQIVHISNPNTAKFPKKVQEYLKHTKEDIHSVVKAQWIIEKAITNTIDFSKHEKLSVINKIIPHRDILLSSIANFTKHVGTMEGRKLWDNDLSKTSRTAARSAEKIHEFRTELSTVMGDPSLDENMKDSLKHLLNHLLSIYQTLDDLTTINHDIILEYTGGTFSIQKRDLKVMIESIPFFTGGEDDESKPWADVEAALDNIPEIVSCNQADAISKFLTRLGGQARQSISELDIGKGASLKSVTDKLKLIYGNPVKVLRQIRRQHLTIGDLNHPSAAKRFQQVMQHKLLIQRTNSCLSKAENKEEANSVLYIRDELFTLIKLLPKNKLDMAKAMYMSGNQNGFQLTHRTTAKQMYSFFTQAIMEIYDELEAEISIISNTTSSIDFPNQGLHLQHDTSRPPPPLPSLPKPGRTPHHPIVPTPQQQDPKLGNKMCYHCDQIAAQGLTDVTGKPFTKEFHLRKKNQKFAKFSHPENCAQFMSLSAGNRVKVLSAQEFCIACAGKHGTEKLCSLHWTEAKRPKSIRCRYLDRNSKEQCSYHITLCKEHLDFNIEELSSITQKLGLPKYPVPHQIAMTIQTVEELDVDPGIVLKCPQPQMYTVVDTCYNSSHEVDLLPPTYPASRKLLFIYTVRTNTNRTILVLADPGATLSILNSRAISLVGPCMDNGTTRLKGLSNNQVGPAIIKRFSLMNYFASTWINKSIDAAVLDVISTSQSEDLTQAICTVLKSIEIHRPDIMKKHSHFLKLEHFQKIREGGDVDILIGVDRQSMHPKPLIIFNQDIAICYVRQPVNNQEFLILTGPTQDIRNLDGQMESFIDPQTSLVIQNSQHISIQDRIMHASHCYLNQHDRMEPGIDEEEEITEEEENELEEQTQDHPGEVNSATNIDPSEEEDILPLIAHLTSSDVLPSNMENKNASGLLTNNKEQSSDVTIPDINIELASETITSDLGIVNEVTSSNMESENIEKIPSSSGTNWGNYIANTVFKWFSNKESAHVLPNNSESSPISNDNVASQQSDQHFLATRPPRMETP